MTAEVKVCENMRASKKRQQQKIRRQGLFCARVPEVRTTNKSLASSRSPLQYTTAPGREGVGEMAEHRNDKVRLLFVGSPLLDISAPCDRATLETYGLRTDDCVLESEEHEALFRSLLGDRRSRLSAGGSSQNSARIAKWTLAERADVAFAGCVGEDEFASAMESRLRSEGVEPLYVLLPGESTGICACLLPAEEQGARSMCARLGAAERFSARHLTGETGCIRERALRADLIYVEGYFLSHSPDVMRHLASTCPAHQLFCVGLSAEYVCRDHAPTLMEILPRVDVLIGNEAEARVLVPRQSVEETAAFLASCQRAPVCEARPRVVLVTRGPRPVVVCRGSEPPLLFPVPGDVTVRDSVGCGDALAGAFLAVYALTGDPSAAVRTGIEAATRIAQVPGCDPPTDTGGQRTPLYASS